MKRIINSITAALFFICVLTFMTLASASQAASDVVLTVELVGPDGAVNSSQSYTMDDLRALQLASFETETIWTEGVQSFTGVTLASFVQDLGLKGGEIEAIAINEYSVKIPVSDAVNGGPIIAFERNNAPMSIRNKGPLWVVYPYDSDPAFQTEAVYSRSIWQLEKLIIKQ